MLSKTLGFIFFYGKQLIGVVTGLCRFQWLHFANFKSGPCSLTSLFLFLTSLAERTTTITLYSRMSSAVHGPKEQQSFLSLIEKKLLLFKSNYKQVRLSEREAVNKHDNRQGINYMM